MFCSSFSYSYDPTHTLQYNLSPSFGLPNKFVDPEPRTSFGNSEVEAEVFDDELDKNLLKKPNEFNLKKEEDPVRNSETNKNGASEEQGSERNSSGGIITYDIAFFIIPNFIISHFIVLLKIVALNHHCFDITLWYHTMSF